MTVRRLPAAGRFDPENLFNPGSVAIIGADSDAGAQILANLAIGGFTGAVHMPRDAEDLPANVALTVLAIPAEAIGPAMTQLARKNCFAAIVPGAAPSLAADVARTGVRALGGHSFGLVIPRLKLNASRAHIAPPAGRVALVSQSAALSRSVIDWAGPNGIGFSHIVGLGGNADIGFSLTLDWLSRDAGTRAILLDIRRIKDRRRFLSAARAAARLRPVVAIHAGLRLLDADGAAARSFEAALRRAGVLSVDRLEDLLAAAETLSRARPLHHDSIAIVSNAIGPARLAADAVRRNGLCLQSDAALVDGIHHVASADLAAAAHRLASRTDLGGVLVVHAPQGAADEAAIANLCTPPANQHAALLTCAMGETTGALHRATLGRAGLPVFATPTQAVAGFEHLVRDRRNREAARELPPNAVLALTPDQPWVRRIFAAAGAGGRLALTQDEALDVLGAYGVPTVPSRVASTTADAISAAGMLGFPAVLKLRETAPPAERVADGLMLDLRDAASVAAAAQLLAVRRGGDGTELLVQRQVGRAKEVAIDVADDATFGPIISFGPGGTLDGRLGGADKAADLPPLNLPLARALIRRSPIGALLGHPLRDRPAADIGALAETLVRISQLVIDFPQIAAMQVPSLFVDQAGVLAADAWLRLRGPDEPAASLAIAPYPAELIEHAVVGGERMTLRPIRPEDAAAHGAFFSRLSPEDIRYRFFSTMRALSAEQMARLTQVDYDREMAFVAVRDADGATVGVVRLVCEAEGTSGEFAVIVQADMKGRGLASRLMRRLIDWAQVRRVSRIVGQVLADNQPMLAFVRHLGFSVKRRPEEPDVMEVWLQV